MKNSQKIGILPSDYREQKSREQAAFQEAARGNKEMIQGAMVFRGIMKSHCVKIVLDPSLVDEDQYVY
jgi:hypothetical protein